MMKFPWTRRQDEAKEETAKARHQYEWAVAQRTTVSDLVSRVIFQGDQNRIVENLNNVIRGGHK